MKGDRHAKFGAEDAAGSRAWYKAAQKEAAQWLALREARAFTAAEHASFADWRARDPRHAVVFSEVEAAWREFDRLGAYPHSIDRAADPDLLAAPAPAKRPRAVAAGLLMAASVALAAIVWIEPRPSTKTRGPATTAATPEQSVMLPDGTAVELNAGARIEDRFTPEERRVVLVEGEAHFDVAHNAARPFIVEVRGVAVRAIGTAFNVRLATGEIEVLVTEGKVQVAMTPASHAAQVAGGRRADVPAAVAQSVALEPGQRTLIEIEPDTGRLGAPIVDALAPAEIDRKLAWQKSRLVFDSTPLAEAIARIEQHASGPRLVLGDEEVGNVLVSGRIHADRVESFVEVLEVGFGISAERSASGEIVLRKRR